VDGGVIWGGDPIEVAWGYVGGVPLRRFLPTASFAAKRSGEENPKGQVYIIDLIRNKNPQGH